MKKENKKQKESRLNALYFDCYSESQAIDNFIYLTNKERKQRTTKKHIIKAYYNRELGTLLRRLDPIAFNCSD